MNSHNNARLTPKGREDMVRTVVDQCLRKAEAARRFNTTPKTVAKWVDRFKAEGVVGLLDRSSKPLSSPSQISRATADAAEVLRCQRRTQQHIATELGISKATVSRILKRRGLSLLSALEPQQPRPRYECATPGEIIHIDIKKLGRFNAIGHRITGDRRGQSNARQRRRTRLGVTAVIGAGGTEAGWGNGKAVAVLFAREGAYVVAADVDGEAVDETRAVILSEGGRCDAIVADATVSADIARAVSFTLECGSRIDILRNNVGGTIMGDPVAVSEADWQRAIDLNLTSAFLACKHVLPVMQRQGAGAIVNVSSLASVQINAYPYFGYLTAKAGLNHFTRALAVHYAPHGIRANAVLPGVMDTPLIHREIAGQHPTARDRPRPNAPCT